MEEVTELAKRVAARLAGVEGVVAVALGGSWARGTQRPDSDIDLGIYYRRAYVPAVGQLCQLAQELDDRRPPAAATSFGEWGPWIDGGAWLQIEGRRVDWLYRDLDRVGAVIEDCRAGRAACYYQAGHPLGFVSAIYMGEIHACRPLFDPGATIAALKERTSPYPSALQKTLIHDFLWEADFTLQTSVKAAARGDILFVSGALFRSAACLVQVLFARNERYLLNEKGALQEIEQFPIRPTGFYQTLSNVLSRPGVTGEELRSSIRQIELMMEAVHALCGRPRLGRRIPIG